jgi:GMC oxidoreductase
MKLLNNPRYSWRFDTEPEPNLNGRSLPVPRGKTLGGSSSINGMVYVRGNPLDYDTWAQFGNRGWSYESVLPYFKKSEHYEPGGDDTRGRGGPLNVAALRQRAELADAFMKEIVKYYAQRRGVLSLAAALVHGFVRTGPELEVPDVQYLFSHASYSDLPTDPSPRSRAGNDGDAVSMPSGIDGLDPRQIARSGRLAGHPAELPRRRIGSSDPRRGHEDRPPHRQQQGARPVSRVRDEPGRPVLDR